VPAPASDRKDPGHLGKYHLRRHLGEGSTSDVWLAYDAFARREVAIKIVRPDKLRDSELGKRYQHMFLNEASLAGKLLHPHIVQIYDAVSDASGSYIVMEYVPGKTMEAYCRPDTLLPIERLVEIVFKCTRALDYAFHLGITHRDIKPANILVSPGGDIKISDFGAALMNTPDQTQVVGIGSPAYMSPEQVRELPLDHQTDIYSLGVVMYQLLTGRLPFQATNQFSLVQQICGQTPPPPSSLRTEIPPSLDAIVARAMQKAIETRYQNWGEFAHDLAQAFRNEYIRAHSQRIADSEKFESLRALPLFAEFNDVELWEVVRLSSWDRIAPGTTIIRDGEPGDYFCILAEGEVKIVKHGNMLNVIARGDCFGEMAVIGRERRVRGADVIALTDVKLISITAEALERASEPCRMHFYRAFLDVLADRLAVANARLAAAPP
jgi:serine/threonine protein kinase